MMCANKTHWYLTLSVRKKVLDILPLIHIIISYYIFVEMMGLIGMGNNPMVGATVACAVAVEEASK